MKDTIFEKVKNNLQCFNRPIYETIIDTLLSMIESGELPEGTKFPPDKKLAIELGISHITLAKALNELRRRGVLDRRRASGTSIPIGSMQDISQHKRKKIAVVFDYASENTFQQSLFLQLHHGLEAMNCTLLFYSSDNNPVKQARQLIEIMQDITISGCIAWSILNEKQVAEVLKFRPCCYPLIFLDKYYPNFEHDAVTYADFDCGAAIANAMLHRKIKTCYWIQENKSKSSVLDRYNGFCSSWKDRSPIHVIDVDYDNFQIPTAFPDHSAIICSDGLIALCTARFIKEKGIEAPKALYTICTDSDSLDELQNFTIYSFMSNLGNDAINILASRLNGKESCTVKHSGKWSVLEVKQQSIRKSPPCRNLSLPLQVPPNPSL